MQQTKRTRADLDAEFWRMVERIENQEPGWVKEPEPIKNAKKAG